MTPPGAPPFLEDNDWLLVTFAALLVAPWAALAAISLPPPVTAYQSGRSSIRAGRAYAAYGGIYIAASLVWLWLAKASSRRRAT